VWVFIGADAVIFALFFVNFMKDRQAHPALFEASRQTLNATLGGLDTLILLTSSWCVALGVQALRRHEQVRASQYWLGGVLTGLMFVVSKSTEYAEKFAAGIVPATNPFYMWYFTLTGIHLVHVVAGTCLLAYVWVQARRRAYDGGNYVVPESIASFWHLVDLLWIFLFPLLYLLK
jgi:nitric oxide reductase NorE protein